MKKIAVMGVGMVGGAHQRYFKDEGHAVVVYDPPKGYDDATALKDCDAYVVCVPTPYSFDRGKQGFDISYVVDALGRIPHGGIAIIKSTVLPGSTEKLQAQFPHLKILFSPEFLSEATADEDMRHPTRQIIGYTDASKDVAAQVLDLLPDAPFKRVVPAKVAEMVKYFNNTFYATKVVFANQMYDLTQALGVDYNLVKECVVTEPMMGKNHWEVFHKGYRGYGGACLPKDTRALIQLGDETGREMRLLKLVEELNQELTRHRKQESQ